MAFWYILWPFGKFYGHLIYFYPFGYNVKGKIWQPLSPPAKKITAERFIVPALVS
jgi:hypothetical protein